MGKREEILLCKAKEIYKHIFPCGSRKSFAECFTEHENRLFFWFDTEDESTHILIEDLVA